LPALHLQRPRTATVALLTCLLLGLCSLPAGAAAKASRTHKAACSTARKSKHGSASRCAKTKTRAPKVRKTASSHSRHSSSRKHAGKPGATVVFLSPATCEDESTPTRNPEGSYACDDGSEPACEDGSTPVRLSATSAPMCRLTPGQDPSEDQQAECEGESGQCTTVEWACEGEGEAAASQNCEAGGEDTSGEEQDS
jgi:hypothetical protein